MWNIAFFCVNIIITLCLFNWSQFTIKNVPKTGTKKNPEEKFVSRSHNFDKKLFISHHESLTSSPALLRDLAEQEEIMVILMEAYVEKYYQNEDERADSTICTLIQMYVEYFEETTGKLSMNWTYSLDNIPYRANNVAWSCLTTFHMIKRIFRYATEIVENLNPQDGGQYALQRQLLSTMGPTGWPTEEDLKATMDAILRLQHVHDFDTLKFSNGQVKDIDWNVHLWAEDCFEIGHFASTMQYYYQAVEWLEIAETKLLPDTTTQEDRDFLNVVQQHVAHALQSHDNQWNVSEPWDVRFYTEKVTGIFPASRQKRRNSELNHWRGRKESAFGQINYCGLCAGENHKDNIEKSKLFCWYESEINFVWKIKPLKAELLSIHPLIVQYYDVIGNELMDKLKKETIPNLTRSTVLDDDNVRVQSFVRTSSNTFIDDHARPEFMAIPKIIELITGFHVLKPTSSEFVQVASYSAGGHYGPHADAYISREDIQNLRPLGDRLGTFIYYLSNVERGGETAFVQAGVASKPIKGSAVMWYNLMANGDFDTHTWHGACPVVQGEKWIGNKWILSDDQMFIPQYKCCLNKDTRLSIKVNGRDLTEIVNI